MITTTMADNEGVVELVDSVYRLTDAGRAEVDGAGDGH
jgi:hypothetical protein